MFETIDGTEIDIQEAFSDPGHRYWPFVKQSLHMPWFYVAYRNKLKDGGELSEMVCLTRVEDVVAATDPDNVEFAEVNIMLPGHMTGKGRWTMEPLDEIWSGIEKEPETQGQIAYVYVTASGGRYLQSGLCTHETQLQDMRRIFRHPSPATQD